MNNAAKYTQYALAREMMETPAILKNFRPGNTENVVKAIGKAGKLFFTGEGSSRIFPAKNAITRSLRGGLGLNLAAEGGRQALEYHLEKHVVFGASNSGQTKEVIALFDALKRGGHKHLFGLTANKNTKLESLAGQTFLLSCGKEDAVAATKSVAEQALFYQSVLAQIEGRSISGELASLGDAFGAALSVPIPKEMTEAIANAGTIYFAGRNDGVAEELTLKTNEITRKKSDYLEGTYAVHGIEEVMNADDVVILIDPYEAEVEKIRDVLVKGVGLKVFAVAARDTIFPTVKVKDLGEFSTYVYLAAGWNILVEVGIASGINLDKPVRARKVGNEFVG
ncbi:MAG TPA: sugar isomerase [Acidobacteriota bacterium]|nr:sugar isomerase [Acidobacteriota bacterium]